MHWVVRTFKTSLGKKIIMALSGLSFCLFLAVHLVGNLTIYWGSNSFNAYVKHLHSLEPLIGIFEVVLLTLGLIHILIALVLFFENRNARPKKYAVKRASGGRTIGSGTMPYTGLFLLAFIFIHLFNFHFVDKSNISTYNMVSRLFSHLTYVLFYSISAIVLAIHISHGFWSAFQSIGINHIKYTNFIKFVGLLFAIITGIGFGLIPVYLLSS